MVVVHNRDPMKNCENTLIASFGLNNPPDLYFHVVENITISTSSYYSSFFTRLQFTQSGNHKKTPAFI